MSRGIVLLGPDKAIQAKAKSIKLDVMVAEEIPLPLPFDQTLVVAPKATVPWDLLEAGWGFLVRWDAAAPLWRYQVLCGDLGTKEERAATEKRTLDLRVPTYACELLFVNRAGDGGALAAAWARECAGGADRRLAFSRALCEVKPRFCVLPCSWLAEVRERNQQDARSMQSIAAASALPLVRVEVAPGRFVKCRAGEELRVIIQFEQRSLRRSERRKK